MTICFCHPVLNDYGNHKRSFFEVLAHSISVRAKMIAIKKEIDFVDLTYTAAKRDIIESQLKQNPDISIFVFAGHADSNGLWLAGQDAEVCLDANNAYYLAGKKVYLICCSTSEHLAKEIVYAGAKFCLCFTDKVFLMSRKQEPVLVRCLIEGLIASIECNDSYKIWKRVIDKHKMWILRIIERYEANESWLLAAAAIDWNMEHFAVVYKETIMKGVSILPKMRNTPGNLSAAELDSAIKRIESWIEKSGDTANGPILVTGNSEEFSPKEILRILKERRENEDWGHNDLPERYLILLTRK